MDQAELLYAVRRQISDVEKSFLQTIQATGGTNRYQLEYAPVRADSVAVHLDGVEVTDDVAVEEHTGVLIFDDSVVPARNQNIAVAGMYTRYFTDAELTAICEDATAIHINNRTTIRGGGLTLATMDSVEDLPVQLLCAIQAIYVLLTDAAFDIDINAPDGVNIPRSQRYRQLFELLQMLEARYKDLSSNLNIGLYAMEVFTLRRTSQRTGRLIPIFKPREYETTTPPERLYLPIGNQGAEPIPVSKGVFDIDLYSDEPYAVVMNFQLSPGEITPGNDPYPMAGWEFFAPIVRSKGGQAITEFKVDLLDDVKGIVRLSLDTDQVKKLPSWAFWEFRTKAPDKSWTTRMTGNVRREFGLTRRTPLTNPVSP